MKKTKFILFLCCIPFLMQAQLRVKIEGIEEIQGQLKLGIYTDKEEFAGEKPFIGKTIKIHSTNMEVCISDTLKEGKYAISAYQDLNCNGQLDKNWFGIPSEKYGFSNNSKVRKIPDFNQSSFYFQKEKQVIIRLQ